MLVDGLSRKINNLWKLNGFSSIKSGARHEYSMRGPNISP